MVTGIIHTLWHRQIVSGLAYFPVTFLRLSGKCLNYLIFHSWRDISDPRNLSTFYLVYPPRDRGKINAVVIADMPNCADELMYRVDSPGLSEGARNSTTTAVEAARLSARASPGVWNKRSESAHWPART